MISDAARKLKEEADKFIEELDNQQEHKMTREEAIKKIYDTGVHSSSAADLLVTALEALGLLKFEEPEPPIVDNTVANIIGYLFSHLRKENMDKCCNLTDIGYAFIVDLEKAGYKIVKEQS